MAKDKFLLVSLKDDDAKKLAQVITNDTSRRILDHLAESEATETQISQALSIPLPTVHYNLKALVSAKLVVADQFHYSAKGREVNHYRLANKYIIIAPAGTFGLKERLKSILPVVPIIGGAAFALEWVAQSRSSSVGDLSIASEAAPMAMRVMNEAGARSVASIAPSAPEIMAKAAPEAVAQATPDTLANGAAEAMRSVASAGAPVPEAVVQSGPTAVQSAAAPLQDAVADHTMQYIAPQPVVETTSWIMAHPGLWLLVGAIIAIGVWLFVDYIRSKK